MILHPLKDKENSNSKFNRNEEAEYAQMFCSENSHLCSDLKVRQNDQGSLKPLCPKPGSDLEVWHNNTDACVPFYKTKQCF